MNYMAMPGMGMGMGGFPNPQAMMYQQSMNSQVNWHSRHTPHQLYRHCSQGTHILWDLLRYLTLSAGRTIRQEAALR